MIDLKRQVAAECRVKHGMTVLTEDPTRYGSQDNGLTEVDVREKSRVWREH